MKSFPMPSAFKKRMELVWKRFFPRAVTGRGELTRRTAMEAPWPSGLQHAGLYLHVPFCRNLCPFCPYNRMSFRLV